MLKVKNEIPYITNLATTDTFTAVENKIPNFNDLVKKTDYKVEIKDISPHLILSSRAICLMQR